MTHAPAGTHSSSGNSSNSSSSSSKRSRAVYQSAAARDSQREHELAAPVAAVHGVFAGDTDLADELWTNTDFTNPALVKTSDATSGAADADTGTHLG